MQHWLNLVPIVGLPPLAKVARDDHSSDPDLTHAVRLLLDAAAQDYVTKNQPWPKRTEACDKSS